MRGSSIFLNIIPIIIITNIDRHHPRHNRRYHQQYHDEYYLTGSMSGLDRYVKLEETKIVIGGSGVGGRAVSYLSVSCGVGGRYVWVVPHYTELS